MTLELCSGMPHNDTSRMVSLHAAEAEQTVAPLRRRLRWRLRGRFPEGELASAPYAPLIRHLLWHRGARTSAEAAATMEGAQVAYDAMLLPDAAPALARLRHALEEGELITVYGDFDVDGVTASAILAEGLAELGGRVMTYLPDRFSEGYGVNATAIQRLADGGVSLILTADCGTSSVSEVALASKLGVDTIIVDHHTVPPVLPQAAALVNPKRAENRYPDAELASGGLSFKLISALYASLGRQFASERYLDLVALSTVCDVAPLQNENRWLVKQGILALRRTQRPGLRALIETAGLSPERLDADSIGYTLGPRLNAAGRLAHARLALELLMEADEERAMERALELTGLNRERQEATQAAMDLARGLLAEEDPDAPLIFVGHPEIPSGIVGLVAGRLAEEHYRPAVVYEQGGETSRASCRSIPEFDITGALRTCPELMVRFGGHRAAAGFTAENAKLPVLKEALVRRAAEELAGIELMPVLDIDAQVPLHRINGRLIEQLFQLAPFGCANPEPTFLSRDLEVADVRTMGEGGQHLRLRLRDGRVTWPAVAFGFGAREDGTPSVAAGD
ncbi:MAG: single-stranded-DNA-specific exonuclease RecJ, partial [Chloroflexi bacterium]